MLSYNKFDPNYFKWLHNKSNSSFEHSNSKIIYYITMNDYISKTLILRNNEMKKDNISKQEKRATANNAFQDATQQTNRQAAKDNKTQKI